MHNPASSTPRIVSSLSKDRWATVKSVGVGSLTSWYEKDVQRQRPVRQKLVLHHPNKGPVPLFPRLDVMPGSASAPNQALWISGSGLRSSKRLKIDNASIEFQTELGKLHGFRLAPNTSFPDEKVPKALPENLKTELFELRNETIFTHEAQGTHGRHYIDPTVEKEATLYAQQTTMGDAQMGRHHGFERQDNPAISGDGELAFHNPLTLPPDVPGTIPMDPDAIRINEEVVLPEDTAIVLGGNVAPDISSTSAT